MSYTHASTSWILSSRVLSFSVGNYCVPCRCSIWNVSGRGKASLSRFYNHRSLGRQRAESRTAWSNPGLNLEVNSPWTAQSRRYTRSSVLDLGAYHSRWVQETPLRRSSGLSWGVSLRAIEVQRGINSSRPWDRWKCHLSTSKVYRLSMDNDFNLRGVNFGQESENHSRASYDLPDELTPWPEVLGTNNKSIPKAEAIKQVAKWLEMHSVVDPEPSAAELVAKAAGFRSPQDMFAGGPSVVTGQSKLDMTPQKWIGLKRMCWLRAAHHVPVQYLVGEWDFHNLSLEMEPPSLIPRPETEELVEIILEWLRQEVRIVDAGTTSSACAAGGGDALRFLDVGSGTGAIGLALLNELPDATCMAIDVQEPAVMLSQRNAQRVGVHDRYSCMHASITDFEGNAETEHEKVSQADQDRNSSHRKNDPGRVGIFDGKFDGTFDFIVSNPPYIPKRDMAELPPDVAAHEDGVALDGGEDGLDVVREIVSRCQRLLKKGGPRQLWMEVDTSHPEVIQRWLGFGEGQKRIEGSQSHGVTRFEWMKDMSQRPRFVRLTFAEEGEGGVKGSLE